ncbi:MAG: LAGLIDADG family homing endonuclease [Candidatus Hadarchaeaceae archaeon]
MSIEEIVLELGKDYRTVNRWIRKLGIKPRPNIKPLHLSKLVPYKWMEETKLDVINGKPVRLTSIYPTSDLSYLVGFAIGDGWIGNMMIELCNTEFGLLNPLLFLMNCIRARYGGKIGLQYREFKTGKNVARKKAYSFRIWLSNSNLARLIKQENQLRYETLDFLMSTKPGHFLAGLWDADGCVSYFIRERLCVEVKLTQSEDNLELLRRIAKSLNKFGISTTCRLSDKKHDLHEFYGQFCPLNKNVYTLHILKESVQDWVEIVGKKMLHPKKVEKINHLRGLLRMEYG